ncbi:hypothetical protein E4T53_28300 (plasmid) [Escherichia coli O157:H7]|nr:hypothetical protein E4T53_28300 [Escherichia coli O157:H7]
MVLPAIMRDKQTKGSARCDLLSWKDPGVQVRIPVSINSGKRTARAVLTGMCYSAGSAMRHGSSSLTRLTGQSAMTPSTWRR